MVNIVKLSKDNCFICDFTNVCLILDYSRELKERTKECEKLTIALEKHQDSSLRKINELNDAYTNEKEKYDNTINLLEGNEKNLNENVEKLVFVSIFGLSKCW